MCVSVCLFMCVCVFVFSSFRGAGAWHTLEEPSVSARHHPRRFVVLGSADVCFLVGGVPVRLSPCLPVYLFVLAIAKPVRRRCVKTPATCSLTGRRLWLSRFGLPPPRYLVNARVLEKSLNGVPTIVAVPHTVGIDACSFDATCLLSRPAKRRTHQK